MPTPFRWDLSRREQLGALAAGQPPRYDAGFPDALRACCARVLGAAGDARLVFIGRSPESLFDYLTGALADTSWRDRCTLLNVSLRGSTVEPSAIGALREQMAELALDPERLAAGPEMVALVDLVDTGGTLGTLLDLVMAWAAERGADQESIRRHRRVVGITVRRKNSPNTWRWQQRAPWARAFRRGALRGVSVPLDLWSYLAGFQPKVAQANPPWRWGDPAMLAPPRAPEHIEALRLAVHLHERARTREEREALARTLAKERAMREGWLRGLVLELRG
jgi:hypothetical protein